MHVYVIVELCAELILLVKITVSICEFMLSVKILCELLVMLKKLDR